MDNQGYLSPAPGTSNIGAAPQMSNNAQNMNNEAPTPPLPQGTYVPVVKERGRVGKTIAIVVLGLVSVTFIGLFIWMYIQFDEVKTDVDGQIGEAVAVAELNKTMELQADFEVREKNPYKTFAGPEDYGSLSFEYPKTWSVYEAKSANNGGNYEAYFNPGKVLTVDSKTINALRATIRDEAFDKVANSFAGSVSNGKLTQNTIMIQGVAGNVYEGELSNGIVGKAVIFKLRDKTVVLQTDAAIFKEDFDRLITTVTFVQ